MCYTLFLLLWCNFSDVQFQTWTDARAFVGVFVQGQQYKTPSQNLKSQKKKKKNYMSTDNSTFSLSLVGVGVVAIKNITKSWLVIAVLH